MTWNVMSLLEHSEAMTKAHGTACKCFCINLYAHSTLQLRRQQSYILVCAKRIMQQDSEVPCSIPTNATCCYKSVWPMEL